ncbi:MAG: hypothetical protein EBZ76_11095, partial [Synechococcaceae bacterium WB9_2_170]|nr:hypothetical protein [Synechococcaceae bacterium WB9_2_170]
MSRAQPLLDRARAAKAKLRLWNAELDRLRYPAYYRGRLTPEEANLLLYNRLRHGQPVMAGKLGSVESRLLGEHRYGAFSRRTRLQAHQNAGIFPCDNDSLAAAAAEIWKALHSLELLGCWPTAYQARLLMDVPQLPFRCEMPDLEPFSYRLPWSHALQGQRVLVLHPFVDSFRHQWGRREALFPGRPVLPNFEPTFVATPMTIQGAEHSFRSWSEALESIWHRVQSMTFDTAIIGGGAYSLPLASRIRSTGRSAIHLGGSLQLFFGVFGKRWERFASQRALVNEAW